MATMLMMMNTDDKQMTMMIMMMMMMMMMWSADIGFGKKQHDESIATKTAPEGNWAEKLHTQTNSLHPHP